MSAQEPSGKPVFRPMSEPTKRPIVSLVIPFYNEEDNVETVALEAAERLESAFGDEYEVIMSNDGSKDRTPEIMERLIQDHPNLRAIHLNPNSGQSAALAAGFRSARGKYLATIDGDGQNDPADIPRALETLKQKGVHMVCGVRVNRQDTFIRKLSSRVAFRVRNLFLGDGITDTGCGLKVFLRAPTLKIGLWRNSHRFYPALFKMHGLKVTEIPVNHRERHKGTSKYGGGINSRLWVGLADLCGVMWLKRRALVFRVTESKRD